MLGEFAVDLSGEVVLSGDLLPGKAEYSSVAVSERASVRRGVEGAQESVRRRIQLNWSCRKQSLPRRHGGHRIHVSNTKRLAQSFVIREKEGAAFLDRAAHRSPELILFEGRNLRVKKVSRVERAITQEFVNVSMKSIRPGARHSVNDPARGPAVSRWVVTPQDRELLHGIHSQVGTEHAARRAVRVVVDAYAI